MFFKKKPKKSWLEKEIEFENKNCQLKTIKEMATNDEFDAFVDALCALGSCGVMITPNELKNLQANYADISKLETNTLTFKGADNNV